MTTNLANSVVALALLWLSSAQAQVRAVGPEYQEGIELFKAGDYAGASKKFDICLHGENIPADPFYYAGLTAIHLGQYRRAQNLFNFVIARFKNSAAAKLSAQALKTLPERNADESESIPRETWVPFERSGNHLIVDGQVNNKPIKFISTPELTCV